MPPHQSRFVKPAFNGSEPEGVASVTVLCALKARRPGRLSFFVSLALLCLAAANVSASAQSGAPVLLSQPTSTRAVALDSTLFLPEPFALSLRFPWSAYGRTRVMLFALNLNLQPNETAADVTADAEDAEHRHYNLPVEYVGPVPAFPWMSMVIVRLSDEMGETGDVLVRVSYRGLNSNRVRFGIGRLGGGPADDEGAAPTPAPPYKVSGRVTSEGSGIGGVSLSLAGPQAASAQTDQNGNYTLEVPAFGTYSVTPSHPFYSFGPSSRTLTNLSGSQTNINFDGARQLYNINGQVTDDKGQGLQGIEVKLMEPGGGRTLKTTFTDSAGNYFFSGITAGFNYELTCESTSLFTFQPQSTGPLGGHLRVDLKAARRLYKISGHVADESGSIIGGTLSVTLQLSGSQTAVTSSDHDGNYSFTVQAGGNYTVTPQTNARYSFDTQTSFNNLIGDQSASFNGRLRRYTIGGRVTEGASGLSGVTVTLIGTRAATEITDADGNYLFTDLPAGGTYNVSLARKNYNFNPTARNFDVLLADEVVNSTASLNLYKISGRVHDAQGAGVAGALVSTGNSPQDVSALTDGDGKYSLTLTAEGDYTLTASKAFYVFDPQSRAFDDLSGDAQADFTGQRVNFAITGRVRDAQGAGLPGITVMLSGPLAEATVLTAQDGSYSLTAPGGGSYTLTPSIEGGYYAFTPASQAFVNLDGNKVAPDIAAALVPLPNPQYVLEFDGAPKMAAYGYFWRPDVDLGHFYWEFWAMPGEGAESRYLLSDGYGGAHALLFGFASINTTEAGRYQLAGNIWDGARLNQFTSDEGPAPGEWGHFAVGWDGKNITTYLNGVPVGRSPFAGPRRTPGPSGGGSWLMIGGSDHNNLIGRIAQVRGFENSNPREAAGSEMVETAFAPQTIFGVDGGNFLTYFFRPTSNPPDLSRGYEGTPHHGLLRNTSLGVLANCTGNCPLPQYVVDPTAPNFATASPPAPVHVDAPQPAPNGALVFDSFSRVNSTYVLNGNGGLGSTESGTAGQKMWLTSQSAQGPQPFGILNGRAVLLGNSTVVAWVPTSATNGNMEVRVNRHPGRMSAGIHTGLSFRVIDGANYFFAYTRDGDAPGTQVLDLGYYLNGQRVNLATGVGMPQGWTTLRVVTKEAGGITIYAEDLFNSSVVYSTTSALLTTATGAGLYNNAPGLGLVNRWDDFMVFASP